MKNYHDDEIMDVSYFENYDTSDRSVLPRSLMAYSQCQKKYDPEIAKYITDQSDAFHFCKNHGDPLEVRNNITDSYWAYMYCKYIKDIPEMSKKITDPKYKMKYILLKEK